MMVNGVLDRLDRTYEQLDEARSHIRELVNNRAKWAIGMCALGVCVGLIGGFILWGVSWI